MTHFCETIESREVTFYLEQASMFSTKYEIRKDNRYLHERHTMFKKKLNASKPSEHPPSEEKCLKA